MPEDTTYRVLVMDDYIEITKQYLNRHRTERGSWTRAQIEALGIEWPPRQGWQHKIIGTYLSKKKAQVFEKAKTQFAKDRKTTVQKLSNFQLLEQFNDRLQELIKRGLVEVNNMECPRGSMCTESDHEVITMSKAREWFPDVRKDQMPIRINQLKSSDGRLQITIYSNAGQIIHRRG